MEWKPSPRRRTRVKWLKRLRRITFYRTLRFRLASTFILLLALVLVLVGFVGTKILRHILENQSEQIVREQLGALKPWIHFDDSGEPYWFVDRTDPEEEAEVSRLEAVYVISDEQGNVRLDSADPALDPMSDRRHILSNIQKIRSSGEPVVQIVRGKDKVQYQIVSNIWTDTDHHRKWYVAEGRSLADDKKILRTFEYEFLVFLPIALIACAVVSWYSAGRALSALQSVQRAAERITGTNLGLQIPKRGAKDELDRLIGSFNEMSGRLKSSFEQVRQFSTDVSHELRTPLTSIQGQLEVALFTAKEPEQLKEAIENALQDVERLTNLVRALLLLSQSESGQIPMNKTEVDLNELVSDFVDEFQIPAEANNVQLVHLTQQPIMCAIDRTQIERVITNLLSNGLKYTPTGGWVRTSVEQDGEDVHLIVEDSGLGIPKDHLPHIFDRFYRVPDTNPEKGLGLGLSFVASIVKAHGGQIVVVSELGQGTKFELVLPSGVARETAEVPVLNGNVPYV